MEKMKCVLSLTILTFAFLSGNCAGAQPEQIHISFGSNDDCVVVMWSSHNHMTCVVQYGVFPGDLRFTARSNSSTLPQKDFLAAKYVYRAELKNLSTNTDYFYRVVSLDTVDGSVLNTSSVYNFTLHTRRKRVKFLVYGDMGSDNNIPTYKTLEQHVNSREYAAILHIGDFAYDLHTNHGENGDIFMNNIQPFAARVPYMTTPGNHEIHDNFAQYRTRFTHPGSQWPIPVDKMWYSYDVGPVHFISYSTEVFFSDNSKYVCTQFDWLLKDLQQANQRRDKTPWIIAIGHRPMYCSNANHKDCTNTFLRRWVKHGLEDLFYAQGVDLVIQAHQHSYERLWPVYDGTVKSYDYIDPRAPTHIISGAAGNVEGISWMPKGDANTWSAFRADTSSHYSFGILDVHNHTHLRFDQLSATTEQVLDSFWLVQNEHGPFVDNVTCTGYRKHTSCYCPSPFFYVYYIVMMAVSFLLFVGLLIFILICVWKWHRRRSNPISIEKKKTIPKACSFSKLFAISRRKVSNTMSIFRKKEIRERERMTETYIQVPLIDGH